jgi:serine/threonine protein kinase
VDLEGNRERLSSERNVAENGDNEDSPLRWRKGEVIGEGTFGKVYRGLNEKTGESLAIKQLCLIDGTSLEVESLRKEISVMWDLEHENIVRYTHSFPLLLTGNFL